MSIVPRTLGFEAEYERNVDALSRALTRRGLSQTDRLHDYHCSCGRCSLLRGENYRFRAQRDATCAGEIITNIMSLAELPTVATQLSEAAYEVDAEPGLNAGLHFHVGVGREEWATRQGMLLMFGLYEQSLTRLAAGPFRALRGMNRTVAQSLPPNVQWSGDVVTAWTEQQIFDHTTELLHATDAIRARSWDATWQTWERHANLSPAQNHPTMEVRIWNSTRAAWRIELYGRISHHLASPDVISRLYACAPQWLPDGDEPLDVALQGAVLSSVLSDEDPELTDLIQRQLDSHAAIEATNAPVQFTLS